MDIQVRFTLSARLSCDVSPDDLVGTAEYVRQLQQAISQALHADVKIEACTITTKEHG